jgi:hypothetical protein
MTVFAGALPPIFAKRWLTTMTSSRHSAYGGESGFTGNKSVLFLRRDFLLLS